MKEFEPNPFQDEVFKVIVGTPRRTLKRLPHRPYYIGVDAAEAEGDKSVVAHAVVGKNGITQIWFDEFADMPDYKWYRNPIKWYKWRKLWKKIGKSYERA